MKKGYLIKDSGKYFTVKSPYYERNIRLQRAFGEEYSYDSIKDRIYYKSKYRNDKVYVKKIYTGPSVDKLKLKYSSFYRLYVHYLYVLGKLPPKVHYEVRTKEYYEQVNRLERYSNQLKIIARYNINSLDEVNDLKNKFAEEFVPLKGEREKMWREYNKKYTLNKFLIEENIKQLTEKINKLNFNIKTCNDLITNFEKSREEIADIEKRRHEHIAENLKQRKIDKNKLR